LKILLQKYPEAFSLFFLLKQKESKIQGKRPTSICPETPSQNGGSLSFAKISRTITNVCSNSIHIFTNENKSPYVRKDFAQQ
jgi:hypothetical protein